MNRRLYISENPKSPVAEAYRTLRTNLQFSNIDGNLKRIAVTSPGAGAGKSTTSANLALALAKSDKKVCLIDIDLRKPRQHEIFDVSNRFGLTNALLDTKDITKHLKRTAYENLQLMTTGPIPPNPSELIGSKAMDAVIEALEKEFDIIIFDTPPVGMVTDAAVLAPKMNGIMLVCAAGETDIKGAEYAKRLLDNVGARILGVVLNKIPVHQGGYYKYHYNSYYSGYYEDQPKEKKGLSNLFGLFKRKQVSAFD